MNVYLYVLVMAGVTYLVRMLPLVLARKEIKNRYIKSFLFYVPYACLAAMTFPAILSSTDYLISAIVGFAVAISGKEYDYRSSSCMRGSFCVRADHPLDRVAAE